jgi:hypothetical protein
MIGGMQMQTHRESMPTTKELLGAVFSLQTVPKLHKEDNSVSAVSWEFHDPQSRKIVKYPGKDQQQFTQLAMVSSQLQCAKTLELKT